MSISVTNQFYIYVYLDPRKPGNFKYGEFSFDYEPFYIGKGKGNRINYHQSKLSLQIDKNKLKVNKIKKIIKEGLDVKIIKYKENILEKTALNLEIKMIKTIGRIDLKTGTLTNLTNGGDGQSGRIVTKESRKKSAEIAKNRFPNGPMYNKKHKIETKELLSKINVGKHMSEKSKEKLRQINLGKKMPKDVKNKIKQKAIERYKDKKYIEKLSKAEQIYEYTIISPNGNKYKNIKRLKSFCKKFGLNLRALMNGCKNNGKYKNWKIERQKIKKEN